MVDAPFQGSTGGQALKQANRRHRSGPVVGLATGRLPPMGESLAFRRLLRFGPLNFEADGPPSGAPCRPSRHQGSHAPDRRQSDRNRGSDLCAVDHSLLANQYDWCGGRLTPLVWTLFRGHYGETKTHTRADRPQDPRGDIVWWISCSSGSAPSMRRNPCRGHRSPLRSDLRTDHSHNSWDSLRNHCGNGRRAPGCERDHVRQHCDSAENDVGRGPSRTLGSGEARSARSSTSLRPRHPVLNTRRLRPRAARGLSRSRVRLRNLLPWR